MYISELSEKQLKLVRNMHLILFLSVDYTETREMEDCNLDCDEECVCQLCLCCSVCSEQCRCSSNIKDENEKMLRMFQFGDENYRFLKGWIAFITKNCHILGRLKHFIKLWCSVIRVMILRKKALKMWRK